MQTRFIQVHGRMMYVTFKFKLYLHFCLLFRLVCSTFFQIMQSSLPTKNLIEKKEGIEKHFCKA